METVDIKKDCPDCGGKESLRLISEPGFMDGLIECAECGGTWEPPEKS
jgi:uncharacterized Zn finger protein